MPIHDVIRAWTDAEYRQALSAAEQAVLPAHPAGAITLQDADLDSVAGAGQTDSRCTNLGVCRSADPATCPTLNPMCTKIVWG